MVSRVKLISKKLTNDEIKKLVNEFEKTAVENNGLIVTIKFFEETRSRFYFDDFVDLIEDLLLESDKTTTCLVADLDKFRIDLEISPI